MTDPPDTVESLGPIQILMLAFPGNNFKGEIMAELDRLKERGLVRIIDLLFVRKDPIGNVMVATASDLDWEEATSLGSYLGARAGFAAAGAAGLERGAIAGAAELADGHVFDDDIVFRVTQALSDNTTAALALIEHCWALTLYEAIDRADGAQLLNEWLRTEDVLAFTVGTTTPTQPSQG